MFSNWIFHDERRGVWQVKCRDGGGDVRILREFPTRSEAYRYSAWGIE